jgi:ATP-dependent Clp protease adapter protein ClpS
MPTQTLVRPDLDVQHKKLPLFHVIVHNCDCHSFDDVIVGLVRIVGMSFREAARKAAEVDHFGRAVVATTHKEAAEMYAARLHDEVVSAHLTLLGTSVEPAS